MAGFIAGMLLHRMWRHGGERLQSAATLLQLAAAAGAAAALHYGWSQAWVLISFACLIVATAGDRGPVARALALRPLLVLGTLSYSLYMTHWIIYRLYWMYGGYVFSGLASRYSPENVYALKVASLLALTFAVSWFTYHKIELPARWYLRRLLAR
jgi:peptidoglycan/LPS O-acetylase OafA/YrhL